MKVDQQIEVPTQDFADFNQLITRAWAEGNITGGGGGTSFTAGVNALGLYIDSTAGGGATAGKNALGLFVTSP